MEGTENTTYWSFDRRIGLFNETVKTYLPNLLAERLMDHLAHSTFLISFGIEDYVWNYLPPSNGTLSHLTPDIFAELLIDGLAVRLAALYKLGARKMVLNNLWPMGCTPAFANPSDPTVLCCNESINKMVRPFSEGLPSILNQLKSNLSEANFSVLNDLQFVANLKSNPNKYGITNTVDPCFKNDTSRCDSPDQYLYWDWVQTTEAANHVLAINCFNGTICSPKNIIELVGASSS
ncbi:GDSL esterase/lipase At1g71691-like [Rhododendron vialii]|uniref:GDSL esterase/lipase At1g71691-like n=1 Tax=Rhododendron vialii TaxID=182163 RepID=UPI00265DCBB6|nr:GDSL esterase/lipase At1g71691-like [Rhododendron vialii]